MSSLSQPSVQTTEEQRIHCNSQCSSESCKGGWWLREQDRHEEQSPAKERGSRGKFACEKGAQLQLHFYQVGAVYVNNDCRDQATLLGSWSNPTVTGTGFIPGLDCNVVKYACTKPSAWRKLSWLSLKGDLHQVRIWKTGSKQLSFFKAVVLVLSNPLGQHPLWEGQEAGSGEPEGSSASSSQCLGRGQSNKCWSRGTGLDDLERSLPAWVILSAPLQITVILESSPLKGRIFLGLTLGNELPQELTTNKIGLSSPGHTKHALLILATFTHTRSVCAGKHWLKVTTQFKPRDSLQRTHFGGGGGKERENEDRIT